MPSLDNIEVMQEDREAAARLTGEEAMAFGMADLSDAVQSFARHRIASTASLQTRVAELEKGLEKCVNVIETFKDADILSEGIHAGLRKGTDAPDSHALWTAIAGSKTSAWADAIAFALDPYFSMWGGDEALESARTLLSGSAGK